MKYVVVTGASSGIGYEFSLAFSKLGYGVILVARREERLKELSSKLATEAIVLVHDLAKTEECYALMEEIKKYDIEWFINNAGFGDCGILVENDTVKGLEMIDVNIKCTYLLTKLMLEQFWKFNHGNILNVSSIAGLYPAGPYMANYYASKAYVCSFSSAMMKEIKDYKKNIYIGVLCPGPVNTEFNQVANVKFALKGISVEKCVAYAMKKMRRKKQVIIPHMLLRLSMFVQRFVPRKCVIAITSHQQKKKKYNTSIGKNN